MRKIIFLVLLLSAALLFISCQSDTDTQTEETTGNNETVAETVTTAEVTSVEETVSEIVTTAEATSAEETVAETVTTAEATSNEEIVAETVTTEEVTSNEETVAETVTTEEVISNEETVAETVTTEEVTSNEETVAETVTTEEATSDEETVAETVTTEEATSEEETVGETVTSTQDKIDQPNIDIPLLTIESKDAYTKFLDSVDMPTDFVSYDKLEAIGSFKNLIFLSDAYINDYSSYVYALVDSEGFEITLYVDHNDEILPTTSTVSKVDNTNMRLLSDMSKGVYVFDNITYKYVSGRLLSISWNTQNINYTLCILEKLWLSDYPLVESTFIGKILNANIASQTINEVFGESVK